MSEFETRQEERDGKTVQIVEGRDGNEVARFDLCVEGEELFDLFVKGANANGHEVWDANKAGILISAYETQSSAYTTTSN